MKVKSRFVRRELAAMNEKPETEESPPESTPVLDRNIQALIARRRQIEHSQSREQRVAAAITSFAGSMRFVYLHLFIYGAWIIVNLPVAPRWTRFDPSFVVLAMEASVEAIFISTFILITQNRMQALSETRNDLDLQISLLAEHEVTRLLRLVQQIANKVGATEASCSDLNELTQDVHPEKVMEKIEEAERKV